MRYTTYSRSVPGLLETLNLQALLDQLADFLLQSGFAGGPYSHPFWGEFGEEDPDRSLDALRQAILQALMDSGQLTPDMLNVLRGDSTGDAQKDAELQKQLADLLDQIVQKLIEEGYLNLQKATKMPGAPQPVLGHGGMAKEAAQQLQFNLTDKGIDFLGYRTLKHLLSSIGKSSFGAHETEHLATGVEAEAASKRYEYGDTLNLDVNATLSHALKREGLGVPINLQHDGRAEARAPHSDGTAQGHAPDHHDHRRQAIRAHPAGRADLREFDGPRSAHPPGDVSRSRAVPPQRHPDQHLHAGARPQPDCAVRVFWKLTPDYKFGGCNEHFARDAGMSSTDLVGRDDFDRSLPWVFQAAKYRADDEAIVGSGHPKLNIIERQKGASGAITWVRVGKAPIRVPTGVIGVLGMYEILDAETGRRLFAKQSGRGR